MPRPPGSDILSRMTLLTNPHTLQIKTIVAATDFMESSRLALDYAVSFAHHYGAKLILLHAFELSEAAAAAELTKHRPSLSRHSRQQRLEAFAAGIRLTGVSVEWELAQGPVADTVLKTTQRLNADLLVIGTHGVHRGLDHMLIGSNTEAILLGAHCPTLTIGRHVLGGVKLDIEFNKILYMSDFTPEAAAAAPIALLLGKEFNAPVDVCHLMPIDAEDDPELRAQLAAEYCERMTKILPGKEHEWCVPAFQLDRSMMIDQVLERAKANDAGLIVLGVKTASQLGRHLQTSVAYQLLAKAPCPILTVRG